MMDCPAMLSVIIPVHNSEEYLSACIKSVFSQQCGDYELILVDDGSTDASVKIMEGQIQDHENVKLIKSKHGGVSHVKNLGIAAASGKYITFMDSDDTIQGDYYRQTAAMERDAELDLMVFGIQYIDCVNPSKSTSWQVEEKVYASAGSVADAYVKTGVMLLYSNCNKIYRRYIVEQYGIRFREGIQFGEDRLFNWDYLRKCNKVCYRNQCFYQYYQRRNASLSQKYVPGLVRIVEFLHREKLRCIGELATGSSIEMIQQFARKDAAGELFNVIQHLRAHYPALDVKERKKELSLLMDSELLKTAWDLLGKRGMWALTLRASSRLNTTHLLDAYLKINKIYRRMRDVGAKG